MKGPSCWTFRGFSKRGFRKKRGNFFRSTRIAVSGVIALGDPIERGLFGISVYMLDDHEQTFFKSRI